MARRRILLMHDEGPFRDALARALSAAGHEVEVADPRGARDRVGNFAPGYIVGYKDGLAALAEMPDAQTIVLSRPVNMEEVRRVLREG